MIFDYFFQMSRNIHFETQLLEMMDWDHGKVESFIQEVEKLLELHEVPNYAVFNECLTEVGKKYVNPQYQEEFPKFIKETVDNVLKDLIKLKETKELEN